jgi:hypothetical protein
VLCWVAPDGVLCAGTPQALLLPSTAIRAGMARLALFLMQKSKSSETRALELPSTFQPYKQCLGTTGIAGSSVPAPATVQTRSRLEQGCGWGKLEQGCGCPCCQHLPNPTAMPGATQTGCAVLWAAVLVLMGDQGGTLCACSKIPCFWCRCQCVLATPEERGGLLNGARREVAEDSSAWASRLCCTHHLTHLYDCATLTKAYSKAWAPTCPEKAPRAL